MVDPLLYRSLVSTISLIHLLLFQRPNHVWRCNTMNCSMPPFPVLHYLPEFAQTHVHWVDDTIQLSLHIKWPQDWSFSFSISPSNEYSGLISFRIHWLDLLAVQGTFKRLLQYHSSKASILWHSAFFVVQLSTSRHDCWKNHSFDYMDLSWQSDVSAL